MCKDCCQKAIIITVLIAVWYYVEVCKKDGLAGTYAGEYHAYQSNGAFVPAGYGNRGIYVGRNSVPMLKNHIRL